MKKKFNADFKARIALEAIRGQKTIAEISSTYEVHSTQIAKWKKHVLDNMPALFIDKALEKNSSERVVSELFTKIGELKVENDFLKKTTYQP